MTSTKPLTQIGSNPLSSSDEKRRNLLLGATPTPRNSSFSPVGTGSSPPAPCTAPTYQRSPTPLQNAPFRCFTSVCVPALCKILDPVYCFLGAEHGRADAEVSSARRKGPGRGNHWNVNNATARSCPQQFYSWLPKTGAVECDW